MSYNLDPAIDVYWKMFSIPAGSIPAGLVGTKGLSAIQFNTHRVALTLQNVAAVGSFVWISSKENGFVDAFRINGGDAPLTLEFPPRSELFIWTTGATPDFRYVEQVYQPFRQGVSPEQGGGIRSNVQNP